MSLNEIKKQIKSISKTAQITNAMRLVSTTKYNRIVTDAKQYEVYRQKVRRMVATVLSSHQNINEADVANGDSDHQDEISAHDMLVEKPIKKIGFLVITSDLGLAGNYNTSILKEMDRLLAPYDKEDVAILGIGKPIIKYCRENNLPLVYQQVDTSDYPTFTEVQNLIKRAVHYYKENIYDQLFICYNYAENVLKVDFKQEQILPLNRSILTEATDEIEKSPLGPVDFLYEPNVSDILDVLLPLFAQTQIYGAIIDAKTAEQSSRMQAMGQATDNANDLIEDLNYKYNTERQKLVTNEIIEITNGANAQI